MAQTQIEQSNGDKHLPSFSKELKHLFPSTRIPLDEELPFNIKEWVEEMLKKHNFYPVYGAKEFFHLTVDSDVKWIRETRRSGESHTFTFTPSYHKELKREVLGGAYKNLVYVCNALPGCSMKVSEKEGGTWKYTISWQKK